MKHGLAICVVMFVFFLVGTRSAKAQTFTWQPTSGGLYNTAANWSPAGGPPNAAGEIALYTSTTTQTVTLESSLTTSGHRIENGNITYQLNQTTQSMSAGAGLVVGAVAGQTGRFTILNGTMTGDMTLGNATSSIGFFTVGEDAVFDAAANTTAIGGSASSSGTLTVTNGGDYTGTSAIVFGAGSGSNGTALISGAGSSLTSGSATVGDQGLGELTVSSDATVSVLATTVGNTATGVGELLVSGAGSTLTTGGQSLNVGASGSGSLSIASGGFVTSGTARLGQNAAASGTATVTGAGSNWTASSLAVGGSLGANGGTGTLSITDSGAVNVTGNMEIRATAGTAVTIDGGALTVGGTFTKNGTLNHINGTLHVTGTFDNGASNAPLVIDGATPDDLPTLRLSSASGTLSEVNSITVGSLNRGALVVDLGRNLALGSNPLAIGATSTGDGSITVTGASSTITTTGTIAVGGTGVSAQGKGALAIGPNATVNAGTVNLFPQGTLTIDGGTLNAASMSLFVGAHVAFNQGTINFTAINTSLTTQLLDGLLGSTHELGANRTLTGGAGTLTVQAPLTVDGGSFKSGSSGSLANSSTLVVSAGVAHADFTFTNDAGKTIVVSGSGELTAGTSFTNNGTLLLQNSLVPVNGNSTINSATGVIRGSGVIGGPGFNSGLINATNGDLEFTGGLTNNASTGLISGHDGTLRFSGGLANNGSMAFSGGSMDVYGDLTQNIGGRITVTGGGVTTFYDDVAIAPGANSIQASAVGGVASSVVFLGSYNGGVTGGGAAFIEGDHRPGNSPAQVTFGGDLFYGGGSSLAIEIGGTTVGTQFDKVVVSDQLVLAGSLDVSLINGFNPAAGQSFDILDFASLTGTFDALNLPSLNPGLAWNTSQLYTSGTLSVIAGLLGDYNNNGVVEAGDYIIWRKYQGTTHVLPNDPTGGTIGGAQYATWRSNFGQPPGSGSGTTVSAAVPEPTTLVLLVFATTGWCLGRRRAA